MTDTVEKFLNRILKTCEGKRYLFRGTTQSHSKKGEKEINSSLYRWARDEDVVFHEKYSPFDIEEEILKRAKRLFFADGASNIEILTDLQHFHGQTNLIDFSRSLYIALLFACGKEPHEDGEIILLDPAKTGEKRQEVDYTELQSSSDPFPIEPAKTQTSHNRVTSQSSVFVYPPSGYINQDLCTIITVPANIKQPILDHLREIHNIHTDTIYNDLVGFIANEQNYKTAAVLFYQDLASYNKGEYEKAIGYCDKVIKLDPDDARAYNNRGCAKYQLGQYQEALVDYNKVIELNHPNKAITYCNCGDAKNCLKQYEEAIVDYNKAIELNPNDATAYNNRGYAKYHLEQYQKAISDFNKAIELNSNFEEAYNNRGGAKYHLEQYQKAINDLNEAIKLNPDCAEACNNRGGAKGKLGQHQEARRDLNKAIELNPNFAEACYNLDLANKILERTQEADEDFKMVVKLKDD